MPNRRAELRTIGMLHTCCSAVVVVVVVEAVVVRVFVG